MNAVSATVARLGGLSRRAVAWAGVCLVLLVLLAGSLLVWAQVRAEVAARLHALELTALMIEDQAVRSYETAAVALGAVADTLGSPADGGEPPQIGPQFTHVLRTLPDMRSITVLEMNGRVVLSTAPEDVGQTIPLEALGPLPAPGSAALGPMGAGRYLSARAGRSVAPAGVGFIPVTLHVRREDATDLLVVGLINIASWTRYQDRTLESAFVGAASLLASAQGQVIATSTRQPSAALLGAADPLGTALQAGGQAALRVHDADGATLLVGYRHARGLPLLTVVQQDRRVAVADALAVLQWLLPTVVLLIASIVVATVLALRCMRLRDAERAELDMAQSRIEAGERQLQTVVESVQELIFRTDARGIVTFANQRWLDVGMRDDPVGKHLCALVVLADRPRASAMLARGEVGGMRTAVLSMRDGSSAGRLFELAVNPLLEQGRLTGFAGSAIDISRRVEAERRAEARFRFLHLLQEISPLPICMTDPEGRFLSVNKAWETFMGLPREKVLGLRNVDFLPPQEAAAYDAHAETVLRQGGQMHYEETLTLNDGSQRNVQVSKVLVPNDDGTPFGVLAVKLDVTEFRRAGALAEAASRSKSEFIANISHELRTPLQSILGFSELGLARGKSMGPLALMFEDIHGAGKRMLELVNNLLDISKIESTVGSFCFASADLRCCIDTVGQELKPLLEHKGQRLALQLPPHPLIARLDEVRIQQVIRNILANAIKFSPHGSEITVQAELRQGGPNGEVVLSVRDQGPGIPDAERDFIFQPFTQSSATSRQGAVGTGLGLAICRKIADAHSGSIRAFNSAEGGAVFELCLPCGTGEPA